MATIDPATSRFLDAARWQAALAVVLAHASALLVAGPDRVPGVATQAIAYVQNAGHLAVVVFFVLSGYLVGGQEWLRLQDGRRFAPLRYAVARFSRIYTVAVPALLLTLLLDGVGAAAFDGSGLYTRPSLHGIGSLMYSVVDRDGPATILGNLLMLQTVLVEPLGGNGPLWSLANEWWYYVLFGLVLAAAGGTGRRGLRMAALAAAVLLWAVLPVTISAWFLVWLLGVGAARLGRSWPGLAPGAGFALMAAGFALALLGMAATPGFVRFAAPVQVLLRLGIDLLAGAAFALALLGAHRLRPGGGRWHQVLAGFSFSLYATHFPVLLFLAAVAHDRFGMALARPADLVGLLRVLGFTAAIAAAAWAFAQATERHTPAVRHWLTAAAARLDGVVRPRAPARRTPPG